MICEKCAKRGKNCECVPYDVECDNNFEEISKIKMMYIVTAIRDVEEATGVEIAGVFDSEPKANAARNEVAEWLSNDGYEDFEVYVLPIEKNMLKWYDINKYI